MQFTYFRFKNFKGIKDQTIKLLQKPDSNVYTLVGLNESGKSTILEAINFFIHKPEDLRVLDLRDYVVEDIHDLIPINERDNFNGYISIEAGIEISDIDVINLKEKFKDRNINITKINKNFSYTQEYFFENSKHQVDRNTKLWQYNILGKKGNQRKEKLLNNDDAWLAGTYIKENLPSILYFPNFLFDFPERIYLNTNNNDKHSFYQKIIQDTLDSLENDLKLKDHLIDRILSKEPNDKRSLNSVIGKLQKKLTDIIFGKWNQIFNKNISNREIILDYNTDEIGVYIEFNIKNDVDIYRVSERSLGFRWFFVYILLTQFRSYRKEKKNAIFLFDEPASNLHPSAQMELLKSFEKLPGVIYTTHSKYLINPKWLESTFVIKNQAIDYENEDNFRNSDTNIIISKYRDFAVKHPNQTNYFQPILEVLDYRPARLDLVPKLVFTEGKNDYYVINYFNNLILDSKDLNLTPGTSASNLENLISLYLGWGAEFVILLDADNEGKKQKNRYIERFGPVVENLIFTLDEIDENWVNFELENLISEKDKDSIINAISPNDILSKKTLNRSLQELYLKGVKLDFDEQTIDNFKKVILFLCEKLEVDKFLG